MTFKIKSAVMVALAVLLAALASSTVAQVPQPVLQQGQVYGSFYLGARTSDLSVTSVSSRVTLSTPAALAWVCNTGSNNAYVRLGSASVTVTADNGIPIIAGQCVSLYAIGQVAIAAITASSTTTLQIATGWGSPSAVGGGGNSTLLPTTSGGLSWYFVQPTAGDNHATIKAGAGQVYNIQATNNSATVNYLRLYNATTGFNGCNSATNIAGQWAIPASTSVAGIALSMPMGIAFSTGISICITSGYATTDTTNATASAMSVNIGYK